MGCGVPCGRASPVQCWGDYRGSLYVFFRATSDIFARVFCGFWYAFLKIRVVRAFSGPLARFSWPLARFSRLFRVFRVFRVFRLGGFRSFDFVIFSIFH